MQNLIKIMLLGVFLASSVFAGCQSKNENPDSTLQQSEKKPDIKENEVVVRVKYYSSGVVESETEYVNGVRNGMHKLYDEQGNLISEVKYVNNKMEGFMKTYNTDGSLKVLVPFVNGLPNGEMISYYPDGKIWRKQTYEEGKLIYTKQYTADGKLEYEEKVE